MKRVLVVQLFLTEVQLQFFHTFEETILATVKNWWSLTHGQVYILSIDDGKRIVVLSMESSFSNSVSRKAFPPIVMLPLKGILSTSCVIFSYPKLLSISVLTFIKWRLTPSYVAKDTKKTQNYRYQNYCPDDNIQICSYGLLCEHVLSMRTV